jgi:hypothetical protein
MKVHVHLMNLMKNQIIQKFHSFEILKERARRQRIHLKIFSMSSKCLALDIGHM